MEKTKESTVTRYQIEERVLRDIDLSPENVLTVTETTKKLGISVQAVSQRLNRGNLTTVLNPRANPRQGQRLLLRSEIKALAAGHK